MPAPNMPAPRALGAVLVVPPSLAAHRRDVATVALRGEPCERSAAVSAALRWSARTVRFEARRAPCRSVTPPGT
ncbi:MAG TPA: hypothetical protein VH590_12520, partial [Ktedonobacterales bacterium]